jgi:hypothetical protein
MRGKTVPGVRKGPTVPVVQFLNKKNIIEASLLQGSHFITVGD